MTANMFQRLMAIPEEEYLQLRSVQQVRQPITQQFYNLEKQYQKGEYILDPYKRLATQSDTLDRMKQLKEAMRENIINNSPKAFQTRARALFSSLEPFIKFNERGEIFSDEDRLIQESRLEDLVQHAVRDRRRSLTPKGWPQFVNLLQSHNVPKFMLNRDTLDDIGKKEEVGNSTKVRIKAEVETPKIKRKRIKLEPAKLMKREDRGAKRAAKRKLDQAFLQRF